MPQLNALHAQPLDVPRDGYVLAKAAQKYGEPIRRAVRTLEQSATSQTLASKIWLQYCACRRAEPGALVYRSEIELVAWFHIATWITGVATGNISKVASLREAMEWFFGNNDTDPMDGLWPASALTEAESLLHGVADPRAFAELLPYILDPHGEGSRLSVRQRPETIAARDNKKTQGVFYTPGDVAAYMVREALRDISEDAIPLTVFDPACGSGVFTRAVLNELMRRSPQADPIDIACSCLYGVDIDQCAVSASAFVLLSTCLQGKRSEVAPFFAWHAIRLNFSQVDALRLDPGKRTPSSEALRETRLECRARLKTGTLPSVFAEAAAPGPISFDAIFPELAEGPRVVIGNPPYAEVGPDSELQVLARQFDTLRAAPRFTSDMYPLFVEQMTRLIAPNACAGALVLPLSLACNTGRQFLALRTLIANTPGHWRFAFFDREPHALFGEDVKTRNAILFWSQHGNDSNARISTGPLRKWRGHSRAQMLANIGFTSIDVDIRGGIPKVDGALQAEALKQLLEQCNDLGSAVTNIAGDDRTVYVASTAYNFLNVFLRPTLHSTNEGVSFTENPLHAITCPSRHIAYQVFAILNSRLAFWWWHVHGDGFHVARHVLQHLPAGQLIASAVGDQLAELGRLIWQQVEQQPVVSLNRGRTSLGFSAALSSERAELDALLVQSLALNPSFTQELAQYCARVTTASVTN
jgi:hypothetical protein